MILERLQQDTPYQESTERALEVRMSPEPVLVWFPFHKHTRKFKTPDLLSFAPDKQIYTLTELLYGKHTQNVNKQDFRGLME